MRDATGVPLPASVTILGNMPWKTRAHSGGRDAKRDGCLTRPFSVNRVLSSQLAEHSRNSKVFCRNASRILH